MGSKIEFRPIPLWLLMLACVFGVIVIDHFAWRAADLDRYVGVVGGLSSPIDSMVSDYIGPELTRKKLEDELGKADSAKAYGEVGQRLFKLLGDMGETTAQNNLMERTVQRYGKEKDSNIHKAKVFIAGIYAQKGQRDKLQPLISELRQEGLGTPPDAGLVEDTARWAKTVGLNDFFVETLKLAHQREDFKPEKRLSLLMDLKQYYLHNGQADQAAALAPTEEKYLKLAKLDKLADEFKKKSADLFKKGREKEAVDILTDALAKFPQFAENFQSTVIDSVRIAGSKDQADTVTKLWPLAHRFPALPKDKWGNFNNAWRGGVVALVRAGKYDDAAGMCEVGSQIAESFKEVKYYVDGEKWARCGRQGLCSKKQYIIAYRPDVQLKIDGRLDEEVYQKLPILPGPFWGSYDNIDYIEEAGPLAMEVRIFYTDTDLYVGVRCPEKYIRQLRRNFRPGYEANTWKDDAVEFFIDVTRGYDYQQFNTSASNAFSRACPLGGPGRGLTDEQKKSHDFSTAAEIFGNAYCVEWRIPLPILALTGKLSGRLVNGNVRRNRYLSGPMKEGAKYPNADRNTISWSRIDTGDHKFWLADFWQFE